VAAISSPVFINHLKNTRMETEKVTTVNSLIVINNDRYEGYKTAAEETKDEQLQSMFIRFSLQSKTYAEELRKFIDNEEEPKKDETTNSGKLYRVWMDLKAAVTGKDRKAILASCEFGEDTALKAYNEALEHSDDLSPEALEIIRKQKEEIQQGHDTVKSMRDSA
jgi:uncharacterized protein (TIGR02284 family)